ncbi:MAG: hypothetical protein HC926_01185 [Synechococcaceae cyanobacterium SM2_3_60]|nr:hypothetical protein [Synechococcaceae cyanobacterium SM2_3_60]
MLLVQKIMVDFNKGMMKFDGADSPVAIVFSTVILASVVSSLVWWALTLA